MKNEENRPAVQISDPAILHVRVRIIRFQPCLPSLGLNGSSISVWSRLRRRRYRVVYRRSCICRGEEALQLLGGNRNSISWCSKNVY